MKNPIFNEKGFNLLLPHLLQEGEIVDARYPAKGASSWYPYGYSIMKDILEKACALAEKIGFQEIVLPSFIHGEEFLKECRAIKDFSERVYWSPVFKKDDAHVFKPTIEAQICSLLAENHQELPLPLQVYTIRGVGRYETGKTIPVWKERNVWPFFELFSVHRNRKELKKVILEEVKFMKEFFAAIGLPVLIVERPKAVKRLQEYSEKRIEAVTITPYKRIVVLANIYDLGDIFSRVYNLKGKNGQFLQMSTLGFSGRVLISALTFLADQEGLLVPPSISPFDVDLVIVQNEEKVREYAQKIEKALVKNGVDFWREGGKGETYGKRKQKAWQRGIPLIAQIGREEIKANKVTVTNRLTEKKITIAETKISKQLKSLINQAKRQYWEKAEDYLTAMTARTNELSSLKKMIGQDLLVEIPSCRSSNCLKTVEKNVRAETIGKTFADFPKKGERCLVCQKKAEQKILIGKKWKGEK